MSHAYRKTRCIDNLAEMSVVRRTDLLILNDPMPMMECLLAFNKANFFVFVLSWLFLSNIMNMFKKKKVPIVSFY